MWHNDNTAIYTRGASDLRMTQQTKIAQSFAVYGHRYHPLECLGFDRLQAQSPFLISRWNNSVDSVTMLLSTPVLVVLLVLLCLAYLYYK